VSASASASNNNGNGFGFGFVFRGLGLKIFSNGLSGILFAVLWKMILEYLSSPPASEVAIENENKNYGSKTKKA